MILATRVLLLCFVYFFLQENKAQLVFDPDYFDTSADVKFPENLTNSILSALSEIEVSQSEMITLQNKTFAS